MSAEPPVRCPLCAAEVAPAQEYCLTCGLRLPAARRGAADRASSELAVRQPWTGSWLLPALLGLVIAALGTVAAIAISGHREARATVPTATGGNLTATSTPPTLSAPEPTAPSTTATAPPATTAPRPRPTAPRAISWPSGRRGWTIVLLSLPQSGGRAAAAAKAQQARRGGLRRVGILDSSHYASLHSGYYVVFTGVFESEADAASSLQRARAVFPAAYQREIVP